MQINPGPKAGTTSRYFSSNITTPLKCAGSHPGPPSAPGLFCPLSPTQHSHLL